jgi:acyl-CoA hydrolase
MPTSSQTYVTLRQFMLPEHANAQGNVHGGSILRLVDEAGALAAMRHARSHVVTVAIDSMVFLEPVMVGDLLTLNAWLTYVGTTSMEAKIEVLAENVITGRTTRTNEAFAVYVAIDEHSKPKSAPALDAITPEEKAEMARALERRAHRLARRSPK